VKLAAGSTGRRRAEANHASPHKEGCSRQGWPAAECLWRHAALLLVERAAAHLLRNRLRTPGAQGLVLLGANCLRGPSCSLSQSPLRVHPIRSSPGGMAMQPSAQRPQEQSPDGLRQSSRAMVVVPTREPSDAVMMGLDQRVLAAGTGVRPRCHCLRSAMVTLPWLARPGRPRWTTSAFISHPRAGDPGDPSDEARNTTPTLTPLSNWLESASVTPALYRPRPCETGIGWLRSCS